MNAMTEAINKGSMSEQRQGQRQGLQLQEQRQGGQGLQQLNGSAATAGIAEAAKSLEEQRSMLEEQTHTEVDEVEAEAAQVKELTEAPAAPRGST